MIGLINVHIFSIFALYEILTSDVLSQKNYLYPPHREVLVFTPHPSGNSKFAVPTDQYLPLLFRTSDANEINSQYIFCDATCNFTSLLFCHLFRRTLV